MKSKTQLQGELKSTGTARALYWFFGAHYFYVGKWKTNLLYWITLGGCGVWILIDLFRVGGIVMRYNNKIYAELEEIDEQKHRQTLEMLAASR